MYAFHLECKFYSLNNRRAKVRLKNVKSLNSISALHHRQFGGGDGDGCGCSRDDGGGLGRGNGDGNGGGGSDDDDVGGRGNGGEGGVIYYVQSTLQQITLV